jgi:hypothetical protein
MKKWLYLLGCLLGTALVCVLGAVFYVTRFLPDIPAPAGLRVEVTPERVARGAYLAHHVAVCMDCHSTRDWTRFSAPPLPGSLGVGGERFDQNMGFPGVFVAPNITPHSLKDWSDGEIYRAITSGVSKDGRPLFPIMPYPSYARMATEDIHSIIAYLRSLPPVSSSPAPSKADPPVNVLMRLMPQPASPRPVPSKADSVAYGAYLANASGCSECHTRMDKGKPVGEPYAGGFEFALPGGLLRSPNLTPHPATGIGAWNRQMFIDRFKAYASKDFQPPQLDPAKGEMQTVMPWTMYAGMTEEDLGAIFDYLQSLPAVDHPVERWTVARK